MGKEMTIDDNRAWIDSEWLLVDDPHTDEAHNVSGGNVVIHHNQDGDDVDRMTVSLRLKLSAVVFTGAIPVDTAVVP